MGSNLMTGIPEILDVSIIRILMTDIKSSPNRTTVWIFPLVRKNFLVFKQRIKIMTVDKTIINIDFCPLFYKLKKNSHLYKDGNFPN